MGGPRVALGFCLALTFVAGERTLLAQGTEAPAPSPAPAETEEQRAARLVEELLTSDAESEDLVWLYSRADEYAPSDLTGRPVPAPGLPQRGEGSPRPWDPRWRKFGAANYVLTGAGLGVGVASSFVPVSERPLRARNEVDEWGRRGLGVRTYYSGEWAQDVSDLLLSLNLAFPMLVDSLVIGYWYRRSPELAGQMALISLETVAVVALLQGPISALIERERPYGRDCGGDIPSASSECSGNERYRSFFSGHTSLSFAAAAVTCSHHARHDLFGDSLADGITCGAILGSATTVGLMRVVALKHYVTDVLAGAAAGTLSGLGIPWLLHYGSLARVEDRTTSGITWTLAPLPGGVAVGGTF